MPCGTTLLVRLPLIPRSNLISSKWSETTSSASMSSRLCHSLSRVSKRTSRGHFFSSSANQGDASHANLSLWYPVVGGFAVTVAGGIKYMHDHLEGSEGLIRSLTFYRFAIPKYLEYRYHSYMQSPDKVWDELDRETSARGLELAYELEGFYIKSGQMCATNIGGAFPQVWQDTMSVLQDQVPPQDFSVIKKIVESELDFDKVFAAFEEMPIGSAAIGQVHRATLRDGTPVVVKVRYPNVERLLRGDIRTIKSTYINYHKEGDLHHAPALMHCFPLGTVFAQVAQPVHVPALEEIEKQFMTEFDYVQEAEQLEIVRKNLAKAGLEGPSKLCRVPKAYMEYCTTRVLVMEELQGGKLADGLKSEMRAQAAKEGKTEQQYLADVRQKEAEAKEKGTELKGPSAKEYDMYISLLDKKRRLLNILRLVHNWTIGILPSIPKKPTERKSDLPINHAKMVDDILLIHGHEILVDGYFNGDPHPGNLLLLRKLDGSPQIGLIDYGQVKRLDKQTRHLFAKLIIALDEEDVDEVVRLMKDAGMRTKKMDPEVIYLYAKVCYDEINDQILKGKHIQMFMEDLEAQDPIVQLPRELLMASRCSLIIRGLAQALHQNRSVAKSWRPIAERVLREDI